MTFQPAYKESISPSSIEGRNLSNEKKALRVYESVLQYIANSALMIQHSPPERGIRDSTEQCIGITPDNVIIKSKASTRHSGFYPERVPVDGYWIIELFSFATPVEKVKNDLVQIIKEASEK